VGNYVELALFLARSYDGSRGTRIVPLIDAVSILSLPHVGLLGWQCVFDGVGSEPDEATVLS